MSLQRDPEAIAPDGFDPDRTIAFPELPAEALDQIVGGAGIGGPVHVPEGLEQLVPADGAALMEDQIMEKVKFRGGELEGSAVVQSLTAVRVQGQRAEDQGGGVLRPGSSNAAFFFFFLKELFAAV